MLHMYANVALGTEFWLNLRLSEIEAFYKICDFDLNKKSRGTVQYNILQMKV